jgi:hypothetical protein
MLRMLARGIAALVILGALFAALGRGGPGEGARTPAVASGPAADAAKAPAPPPAHARVALAPVKWQRGGFGAVAVATFTVRNENPFPVKDIELVCEFWARSGTRVGRQRVMLYERLPPGGARTVRDMTVGFIDQQAHTGDCWVVGVSRA